MLAAGLLARNAVKKGLKTKPWVKTSLAPGSKVVTDYLRQAGVQEYLDQLGFKLVGYGCTTCIGNSGPLPEPIAQAIESAKLVRAPVLSGNRNFEGRVNPLTRFNYLASPPLVVAYALAGRMDLDLTREPIGVGKDGPVFLRDIWPTPQEVQDEILRSVKSEFFKTQYADVFKGDEQWRALDVPSGETYAWDADSTYVKNPPYFEGMTMAAAGHSSRSPARARSPMLGDSITTDHISPAGNIPAASPAGKWLIAHGVEKKDFNSYGARRGNHEVMMRGTFANIRLRNEMVPGTEGGWTTTEPGGAPESIYDAAMEYQRQGHSARHRRRQGVRHWFIARLGGEGNGAARRSRRDRRVVRADPSLEPRRHGRAAARVHEWRDASVARHSPASRRSTSWDSTRR